MAEIPIEKKSGMPGWLWLLLGLLVLALLLWLFLGNDDDEIERTDAVVAEQTIDPATALVAAPAAGMMAVGEQVDLDNVRVTSLAGDMAFNAEVNGQPMLVLFDQERTPNDATEGEYDINPGSMVNLTGSVRSAADPLPAGVTAQVPAGTDRYIYADTIEMVN